MAQEILINIGNTHAQFAVFDGENVVLAEKLSTSHLNCTCDSIKVLRDNPNGRIIIASVVPQVNQEILELWSRRDITFISWEMLKWIDFSDVDPATVGADRLANIAAASSILPLPAIIVDCGTAITTEVVAEGPRFMGGAIIPGRTLWRKSLNNHTGLLPQIELGENDPFPIGKNTVEALQVMDCAAIGAVERIIAKTIEKLNGANVFLTGGDAPFFAANMADVKLLDEDFTLQGIAEISKHIKHG